MVIVWKELIHDGFVAVPVGHTHTHAHAHDEVSVLTAHARRVSCGCAPVARMVCGRVAPAPWMVTSDAALASANITSATTARRSVWFLQHTPVRRSRAICRYGLIRIKHQ